MYHTFIVIPLSFGCSKGYKNKMIFQSQTLGCHGCSLADFAADTRCHCVYSGRHKEYQQHRCRYNNRIFYSHLLQFIDVLSANAYWLLTTWWLRQGFNNAGKLSTRGVYYSLPVILHQQRRRRFSIMSDDTRVAARTRR